MKTEKTQSSIQESLTAQNKILSRISNDAFYLEQQCSDVATANSDLAAAIEDLSNFVGGLERAIDDLRNCIDNTSGTILNKIQELIELKMDDEKK